MRALVTGASAGIGRAFAVALAADGYSVTAVARGTEALEQLMTEIGDGHDCLVADLAADAGLAATAERVRHGGYNLLVNNAGTATHGDFADSPLDAALTTLDLNCRAVVVLAHAFLSTATPGSALVNVSSTLSITPKPGTGVYSASKAFVTAFSDTLWYEQRLRGVHVLAMCPGVTRTASHIADDVPSWLVRTPREVVDRARAALSDKSGPVVLTSRADRLFTAALRLVPRRTALALLAR
ncbi:SDR family NAD(P)-dependent oxidoreductase [Nocardia carnea]|uniref:SDR family NAD(P)-dependent oxidoreductase n=1 Tax=Nocardia carnea TaxID=37328 RepID=UPI002458B82D|nr:SDR family NAD(P)-dependent oxidoreductase [Nocardia carnea]